MRLAPVSNGISGVPRAPIAPILSAPRPVPVPAPPPPTSIETPTGQPVLPVRIPGGSLLPPTSTPYSAAPGQISVPVIPRPVRIGPALPFSPISGSPINSSIFQPTQTSNGITTLTGTLMPGGSSYVEPTSPLLPQPFVPSVPSSSVGAVSAIPSGSFLDSLGINQNTFLVILVVIALVLVMVAK